jgi:predicted dinucleotide-binding enzyme
MMSNVIVLIGAGQSGQAIARRVVLEEFGHAIAAGGSGVVISSQSGHRRPALTVEQNKALAITPADDLLERLFSTRTNHSLLGAATALA